MPILAGDALDLILAETRRFDLVATDPPYAFGGSGDEHALTATVAVVLRECARKIKPGGWLVVLSASSWRSLTYAAEAIRGELQPVRVGTWCKPVARTKARTPGWAWQTVLALACRRGSARDEMPKGTHPDWVVSSPVVGGRRAEVPAVVADWVVAPYATPGGLMLDPFAGSGALCLAAERAGMVAIGYEKSPPGETDA